MASRPKISSLNQLGSICSDTLSLKAKIGLATLAKTCCSSQLCEKILLSLEYLQLFTPFLLSALSFQKPQETSFSHVVLTFAKLLNPGYWISFDNMDHLSIIVLILIFTIILFKLLLFAWIAYKLAQNAQPHSILIKIWRIIFKFQGRVTFFYTTSFLVNALTVLDPERGHARGDRNIAFTFISVFAMILEFSFSLLLNIFYKYIFPTKNFLSAKDNNLEIITLIQKFVLQLLAIFLTSDSETTNLWVFATFNLIMDRIRIVYFFKILPLYNFQALLWQSFLLALVSSFNISCFVACIIKEIDQTQCSLLFLLIIWVITFLLNLTSVQQYTYKSFWKIAADPSITSPQLLIHRICAIKKLSRMTEETTEWNNDYKWTLLLSETVNKNLSSILKIDPTNLNLNIKSKSQSKILFKNYLEKLIEIYPKSQFIRLYAAKFFAKKFNTYGEPIQTAKIIMKQGSRLMSLHAEYLKLEIQAQIKKYAQEQSQQNQLNPYLYIQEQTLLAQLKIKILKQADLQIQIYNEMKKENPDLAFILNNSQDLKVYRSKISTKINALTHKVSEYNLEPYLLCAQYQLTLNHSISDYISFAKIYSRKLQKQFRAYEEEGLSHKNLFQDNAGFYFLSGQKSDVGAITFTSKTQLHQAKGSQTLPGDFLYDKTAPCLRNFYYNLYKSLAEDTNSAFFNQIMRGFAYSEDGCLSETDFIFSIHPHITQGFYFMLIFRPVESKRDIFYVLENGDIDGATKNIRELLSFPDRRLGGLVNLIDISEELALVNHAFNVMALPEKFTNLEITKEQVLEIYQAYSRPEGKTVLLKPVNHSEPIAAYNCRIENQILDNTVVKTFILEQTNKDKKVIHLTQPISSLLITTNPNKSSPLTLHNDSFTIGDEKEQGWIDFDPIKTSITKRDSLSQNNDTTRTLLESSRPNPRPRKSKRATKIFHQPTRPGVVRTEKKLPSFPVTTTGKPEEEEINEHATNLTSLTGSLSSHLSQRKRLSNIFKKSLETSYSSKMSRLLIFLFYLTLVILIVSQIILSSNVRTNTNQLQVKKDFLRNFQSRNLATAAIAGSLRTTQEAENGSIDVTKVKDLTYGTFIYRYIINMLLTQLASLNQYIVLNAKDIDHTIYSLLFDENIKIYDTYFDVPVQSYQKLNTLQATDKIIETGLAFLHQQNSSSSLAVEQGNFMFRNTVNDLLVKNQEIADMLTTSFFEQRETIEDILYLYLYVLVSIFVVMLGVFAVIMSKQYTKERRNLLALCQLSNKQINNVLKECVKFKREIEGEEQEDRRPLDQSFAVSKKDNNKKEFIKKRVDKTPNFQGIKRKYFIYFSRFIIIIGLLIALVLSSSLSVENLIAHFKDEQEQITFIDYIKARSMLSMQAYGELFSTNNAGLIENRPALTELKVILDEIQDARTEIYSTLLTTEVLESDEIIKNLLLDDACEFLDPAATSSQCAFLKALGKKTGIVYLLTELEGIMRAKIEDYKDSDKSRAALMEIKVEDYNTLSSIYQVLTYAQNDLGTIINNRLDQEINRSSNVRKQILVINAAVVVVLGLGAWIFVLRKLKAGVREFKNALRLFPAEVIFGSFLLKNFLMKTSKSAIEYVKH